MSETFSPSEAEKEAAKIKELQERLILDWQPPASEVKKPPVEDDFLKQLLAEDQKKKDFSDKKLLANLLDLEVKADGKIEVAKTAPGYVPDQPVEQPLEHLSPAVADFLDKRKRAENHAAKALQTHLRLEEQRKEKFAAREVKRAALQKEKAQQKEQHRKALQNTVKKITPHVTGKGLALAAAKVTLPVVGALAPIFIPGAAEYLGNYTTATAAGIGAVTGLMAGIPLMDIIRRKKRTRAESFKGFVKEIGRNITNVAATGITILTMAQGGGVYKSLNSIENSFVTKAEAGERRTYTPDEAAKLALENPSQLVVDVLQGKRDLDDLELTNTVSLRRTTVDTSGTSKEEVVQVSALPTIYVTPDGHEIDRYNRSIMHPITSSDLPANFLGTLNAIEGLPAQNSQAENQHINDFIQELGVGPLETTQADIFIATLAKRNIYDKFTVGESAGGGASTIDKQFFKLIAGYQGSDSFLNPDIHVKVYHPEKYSDQYLLELFKAIRKGEVIDPATISIAHVDQKGSIVSGTDKDKLSLACEQLERYMFGMAIAKKSDFVPAYLNNIRMGAIRGQEIIGIDGGAQVMFHKHFKDLSSAEQVILVSSIPQVSPVMRTLDLEMQLHNRRLNHEDTTDVEAALATQTYTWEDLQAVSLQNIEEMDKDRLFSTPQEKIDLQNAVRTIFQERKFFMNIPEEFDNSWLENVRGDLRAQIELPITLSSTELAKDPNITLSREGAVVTVNLPELPKASVIPDPDILYQTEAPLNKTLERLIEEGLVKVDSKGQVFYQTTVDKQVRWMPAFEYAKGAFVPGIGAVVLDENGHTLAKYDRTGQSLVDVPFRPASMMKVFTFAFLQDQGIIKSPDAKVEDISGIFDLAHQDYNTLNAAGLGEQGMIPWRQALAESRNIPFMRGMHEYFYQGTEHMAEAEKTAEFTKRMTVFQNFMKDKFGLKIVTATGEEVTNPADPRFDAGQMAMGYANITAMENNMVEVTNDAGEKVKILDMKKGSMEAFAEGILRLEQPEKYFTDPELIQNLKAEAKILQVLGLERSTKVKQLTHSWAKTGTLEVLEGTTATFTVEVVRKGDEIRVVVVQLRGQRINAHGDPVEVNQDVISHAIRKIGAESFHEARPYAEWLVKQSMKMHVADSVDSEEVVKSLEELASGSAPDTHLYVARLNKNTTILGEDGSILMELPAGKLVDTIAEAKNGLQQVAISEQQGEVIVLRTGFIKIADLENSSLQSDTRLQDLMKSEEIQKFIDTDGFFADNHVSFQIIEDSTTSPVLATILATLRSSGSLATSSDALNQITVSGTIFIDGRKLAEYYKEDTEATRAMLGRELKQVGEEIKFAEAIHSVMPDAELDSLLLDKNTPAARLMAILFNANVPGAPRSEQMDYLEFPMVKEHPLYNNLETMRRIQDQYTEIISYANSGREIPRELVTQYLADVELFQNNPSSFELQFLGLPPL